METVQNTKPFVSALEYEPRQFGLAHADGQLRSSTESDYHGSSESAGRGIIEMLKTDVQVVSFDSERKCANPSPFRC